MKVIPVFTKVNQENSEFWSNIQKGMPESWSFKLIDLSDAHHQSIYEQCIIADASIEDLKSFLYFQRTFSLPFLYVTRDELTSEATLEILSTGAIDSLSAPLASQLIKAKILHHFDRRDSIKNEKIISDACFTKTEEQILRVILQKTIKTNAVNIYKAVWRESDVQMKTFNVHISKLRKKLKTINLDLKYLQDKTYHVIKKRSLQADREHEKTM